MNCVEGNCGIKAKICSYIPRIKHYHSKTLELKQKQLSLGFGRMYVHSCRALHSTRYLDTSLDTNTNTILYTLYLYTRHQETAIQSHISLIQNQSSLHINLSRLRQGELQKYSSHSYLTLLSLLIKSSRARYFSIPPFIFIIHKIGKTTVLPASISRSTCILSRKFLAGSIYTSQVGTRRCRRCMVLVSGMLQYTQKQKKYIA